MTHVPHRHAYAKVYDKREDFSFDIVNFPHLDSNIPNTPAYGVFISQLIKYVVTSPVFRLKVCSYAVGLLSRVTNTLS